MYSSKFLKAFDYLMYHEGGYVKDPKDAGGETKTEFPNVRIRIWTYRI